MLRHPLELQERDVRAALAEEGRAHDSPPIALDGDLDHALTTWAGHHRVTPDQDPESVSVKRVTPSA